MIDWTQISTVLLDMDGTLLDLHFDNYFWTQHVPLRYAEKHQIELEDAHRILKPKFKAAEGSMNWYCVDYWSNELSLDIALLKAEVDHLIAVHPHVIEFLERLQENDKKIIMVTNAHQKSLALKMERTALQHHFNQVICSHDLGMPKEDPGFWDRLKQELHFDNEHTLLVDDTLSILRSAQGYGIKFCLAVLKPDSKGPEREVEEFAAITDFRDIMP